MKVMLTILLLVSAVVVLVHFSDREDSKMNSWKSQVMPGKLSAAHALLSTNCESCHTAVKGADDTKCMTCHADNKALLGRQPTAFHGIIGNCSSCHIEHQGIDANLRVMDHEKLARIGEKVMGGRHNSLQFGKSHLPANHPLVSERVAQLNCAGCHSTKDKHFGLMGQNCASCHAATQWTIPTFQHPSVLSVDCAQCHQPPPSHTMEHFEMISKKIANQEDAQLNQCYSCHKTTSWNDIQGVGFYKHH